jgi:hypothetical protein
LSSSGACASSCGGSNGSGGLGRPVPQVNQSPSWPGSLRSAAARASGMSWAPMRSIRRPRLGSSPIWPRFSSTPMECGQGIRHSPWRWRC